MISLIILILMYGGGPALTAVMWLAAGWHFSLSAAPAAYALELSDDAEVKLALDKKDYIRKNDKEPNILKNKSDWSLYNFDHDKFLRNLEEEFMSKHYVSAEIRAHTNARKVGWKCVRRGPFAYFMTPEWDNKIKINWTPVEVNATKMIMSNHDLISKLDALESATQKALMLEERKNSLEI